MRASYRAGRNTHHRLSGRYGQERRAGGRSLPICQKATSVTGRLLAAILLLLAVLGMPLPGHLAAADTASSTPLTVISAEGVDGTVQITVTDLPSPLDLGQHAIPHGDAVRITAQRNGQPLQRGSALPVGLSVVLSYPGQLPAGIPDERLLGVWTDTGADWQRMACTEETCEHALAANELRLLVDVVGDYAVAAPRLGSLAVTPASVTLAPGETARFYATVLDTAGYEVADPPVRWQAAPSAGTIDISGLFRATGTSGTHAAAVTASLGDLQDSADVIIRWWRTNLPGVLNGWSFAVLPNDPQFGWQWNLHTIQAPLAWRFTTGSSGPIVAVLDTGVDLYHPDLAANLIDGWNFIGGTAYPLDDNGHGTHVAGILAAVGNNGIGIAGVSWQARIMPIKILDASGVGEALTARDAIHWAVDNGARVINLSLGSPQPSPYLQEAVQYALSNGAVVVAAVGNVDSGSGISRGAWVYPAAYPGVIGAGATDSSNALASFSNEGPFVDVVAPGKYVLSTFRNGSYAYFSGTSMATPHVSGLAALIWSSRSSLSRQQVSNIILQTARDLGPTGWDPTYGYGLVDAGQAISAALQASISIQTIDDLRGYQPPESPVPAPGTCRPGVLLVQLRQDGAPALPQSLTALGVAWEASATPLAGLVEVRVPAGQELALKAALSELAEVEAVYLDCLLFAM